MRRILLTVGLTLAVVGGAACQPTEPAMITAASSVGCDGAYVTGKVAPAKATTKVILQRTVGGKWVDWSWYQTYLDLEKAHVLSGAPDATGAYEIQFVHSHYPAGRLTGTLHLRVRSNGGHIGPSWYMKIPDACT